MSLSYYGCLSVVAIALLTAAGGAAAAQRAEIGIVAPDGNVQLYQDRFQEKFPDGTAVAEVRADISNGFLQLTRKGFDAQSACLLHVTRVVDASGSYVTSLNPGQSLYLPDMIAVDVTGCNDSGCADDIPAPSRCNITEKSGHKCRCHVLLPDNNVLVASDESLCWSMIDRITSILSHWVKPPFIQVF